MQQVSQYARAAGSTNAREMVWPPRSLPKDDASISCRAGAVLVT